MPAEINKVFIGQDRLVRGVLQALLADGHVLIESVPGLGKTLLVRAMGQVLGCGFNRIQFTPDLMPSDLTGSPIFDERNRCGRMMAGDTGGGLSPLDHALNAMLLLAHVALIRNDQVGLLAFSDRTRAYIPPGGGPRRIRRLVHAVHNVFPEPVEPRYDRAFVELEERCRKRSLVVLLTNLFDEVNAQIVSEYLGNLTGRHLPLGVFLRDHDLFALADKAQDEGATLYQGAAAADLLNRRERVLAGLRRRGVLTLDVFPDDLTGDLVSRYLEIKARHLL